ncbi:MAG: DUF1987 domain-containing protein [Bacteroidia bacterium]
MNPLQLPPTNETPAILFDTSLGLFKISGRSFPMDVQEFYNPLLRYFKTYLDVPQPNTTLDLSLDYYNSTSMKVILSMISSLLKLHPEKTHFTIIWRYQADDEDMREVGESLSLQIGFPIQLVEA